MKALKSMTKSELILELTNTRKRLKGAREALDNEVRLRREDVERTRNGCGERYDTLLKQYQELQQLSSDAAMEAHQVKKDRDFFRRVLEKMSR